MKRPVTLVEWEKSDPKTMIPTQEEMSAFRDDAKEKFAVELERLDSNKQITFNQLYVKYNVDPKTVQEESTYEMEIATLNVHASNKDVEAVKRIQEITQAFKEFQKELTRFEKSKANIRDKAVKYRDRINAVDRRRKDRINFKLNKAMDAKKASVEYVEQIEVRLGKLEATRGEVVIAKRYHQQIAWCKEKILELDREMNKVKEIIKLNGLDR